jgi:hypothetical protein
LGCLVICCKYKRKSPVENLDGAKLPDRYSQRTICQRVLPLELQYVISQTRNGFNYKTLQQALAEEEQKPPRWTPENPIHIARAYLEERGGQNACSYADIARKFGVSRAEVCYHIALEKRLPQKFVSWFEQCDDPEVLRAFTERRLRPITRLNEREDQWDCLNRLSSLCLLSSEKSKHSSSPSNLIGLWERGTVCAEGTSGDKK